MQTQNPTYLAASGNAVPKSVLNTARAIKVTLLEIQIFNSDVIQKRTQSESKKSLTNFWSKIHIAFIVRIGYE